MKFEDYYGNNNEIETGHEKGIQRKKDTDRRFSDKKCCERQGVTWKQFEP